MRGREDCLLGELQYYLALWTIWNLSCINLRNLRRRDLINSSHFQEVLLSTSLSGQSREGYCEESKYQGGEERRSHLLWAILGANLCRKHHTKTPLLLTMTCETGMNWQIKTLSLREMKSLSSRAPCLVCLPQSLCSALYLSTLCRQNRSLGKELKGGGDSFCLMAHKRLYGSCGGVSSIWREYRFLGVFTTWFHRSLLNTNDQCAGWTFFFLISILQKRKVRLCAIKLSRW